MKCLPLLFLISCNIPDADNIHLAECMHGCNANAHACLDTSRVEFRANHDIDAYIDDSQACTLALVDCIVACVDDTERGLYKRRTPMAITAARRRTRGDLSCCGVAT